MKITRQEIVVSFEIDPSIVLSCGSAIKNAQKKLGGRILSINAPDDAPPFNAKNHTQVRGYYNESWVGSYSNHSYSSFSCGG